MCGINYSKVDFKEIKFNFSSTTYKIIKLLKNRDLDSALELTKKLRNNYVFIEIINKEKFIIDQLSKILILVNKLKNSDYHNTFDKINDLKWIIESEILFKVKRIIEFSQNNNINLNKKSIIFIRYFLYNVESMNYLESRGRDSLGISINFVSKKPFVLKSKVSNKNSLSIFNKKIEKKNYLNITIKFSKRIGESGENTSNIISILKRKIKLNKINFENLEFFEIFSHTRWASVGDVINSNCHPLLDIRKNNLNLCLMNGDINNYKDLKKDLIKKKKYYQNDNLCKNDLQPVASLFEINKYKINSTTNGSYVLFNFNSSNINEFYIFKKGSQGLYYTLDEDNNLHFSSDVYGLINKSDKFDILKKDGIFKIDNKFKKRIKVSSFTKSDLLTNDLSLKGKDTFFLKEINDTNTFLKRTIVNYIDFKKRKIIGLDDLFGKEFKNKLKKKKIRNIIFTGMGSCYTAAVGISKYLNSKIAEFDNYNIKVEATIASEGSGFYLSNNMEDTIIIVIAQSGTTIDTNVFAKMAKERGAYTLAIVNKKQGDVTYIVDQSFHLGNGRDIEMSIPSTKTYTCHLIMGFILSEKIIEILRKKINYKFINSLKKITHTKLVEKNLDTLSQKIEKLDLDVFKFNNWVVVYDDSFTSFGALEFRVKISECCYKSIPNLSLSKFNKIKFKNTLVFYLTSSPKIKKLDKSNYYIQTSNKKKFKKSKNSFYLNLRSKDFISYVVEMSFSLQLIAHRIAKIINLHAINPIKLKKNLSNIKKFIFDEKNLNEYKTLNYKNKLKFLQDKLKRPIDVIKHQAKTITVGAIRLADINENKILSNNAQENENVKPLEFNGKFYELDEKINIISNDLYDYEKYYISNIIEYCNSKFKYNKHYRLHNLKTNNVKNLSSNILIDKNFIKLTNKNQITRTTKLKSHDLLRYFLPSNKISTHNELIFQNSKKIMLENNLKLELNLNKVFKKFNNIKFLGSGINYLIAKKYAQLLSQKYNKSIAFDVIENHKHIDISSEALLIIFASNIDRKGFQRDVFSELEKFIAHDNEPIIFTNIGNNIFDNLIPKKDSFLKNRIIKLPAVPEIYSPSIFDFYFKRFIK